MNRPHSIHHLVVVHYHLRPGGVRRIIESALPAIAAAAGPGLKRITLAVGEAAAGSWHSELARSLAPVHADVFCEPAFGYFSESALGPENIRKSIRAALSRLIAPRAAGRTLVWFHNPALGRNATLGAEIGRLAAKLGFATILHHHDFWCANRWSRWREIQECGFRSPAAAARALFVDGPRTAHITINTTDHNALRNALPLHSFYLPNPIRRARRGGGCRTTKSWLAREFGSDAPLWICPTRVLRRKNLAEAILLARWLRPEAWFVTTSGASSDDERESAGRLESAAKAGKWNVRFGLLEGRKRPAVAELVRAAEAVVLTSVQEGFGMGFVEAGTKPLIARALPEIMPDLASLGFRFPFLYSEILIAPELLDRKAERRRQSQLWKCWKEHLPSEWRPLAGRPPFLALGEDAPVPFSRLTLSGQLEILAIPPEAAWVACRHLNPILQAWQNAGPARLENHRPSPGRIHDARAFAREWLRIAANIPRQPPCPRAAAAAQKALAARALASDSLYPILLAQARAVPKKQRNSNQIANGKPHPI